MGINKIVAKIPFFVLYVVLVIITSFNWIRVILFQRNFEVFRTEQPWDYYLSNFFINNFGITHQQYFIFALPVMLLLLFIIPEIVGKLMSLDRNSNVKGDNHVAIILILFIAPVTLGLHKLLDLGWRGHLIPGIILIIIFSILSWLDERSSQKTGGNL